MGTRYFFYDGDRIIAEREGNSWVVRHLLGLMPCGFVAGGQGRIYHADRLGSVRFVTDANQNILVSYVYVYEGFGKVIAQNGVGGGPYQFCGLWGYRNDWDAGLLHVGARYYEPEIGRWIQKDPVWIWGEHIYAYCDNDPINAIDPEGLQRKKPKPTKPKPIEPKPIEPKYIRLVGEVDVEPFDFPLIGPVDPPQAKVDLSYPSEPPKGDMPEIVKGIPEDKPWIMEIGKIKIKFYGKVEIYL